MSRKHALAPTLTLGANPSRNTIVDAVRSGCATCNVVILNEPTPNLYGTFRRNVSDNYTRRSLCGRPASNGYLATSTDTDAAMRSVGFLKGSTIFAQRRLDTTLQAA